MAEFVAKQIAEFESKPDVQAAMLMLDWNVRTFQIFPDSGEPEHTVSDDILETALRPHPEHQDGYNKVEGRIRDIFDVFLESMERFEHFIEGGLVAKKDLDPYLSYWIGIVGDKGGRRKPIALQQILWRYIDYYESDGVQKLCRRFEYDITPEPTPAQPGH